eukprot:COSAG01_NODE_4615_length_4877_cov_52.080185_3_plen_42_part_00
MGGRKSTQQQVPVLSCVDFYLRGELVEGWLSGAILHFTQGE